MPLLPNLFYRSSHWNSNENANSFRWIWQAHSKIYIQEQKTKNNEDISEGRDGRGREEEKEERSSSTAREDFCETVVTETLILMQVSTNWPGDPKRSPETDPVPLNRNRFMTQVELCIMRKGGEGSTNDATITGYQNEKK